MTAARPLDGVLVVGVEQAVAAPFATRQLAELGARVVKVERPGTGDFARAYDTAVLGQSSHFVWANRSKESLTLDLKADAGREVLQRLLARADVLVQNLAPGAAGRLGLDAAALQALHPRLVVCTISGFGTTGPWADRKAYDLLVQCEAGVVSLTGTPDAPARAGIPVADLAAGTQAVTGVLAALLQRATTGTAPAVEVSLLEALADWVGFPLHYTAGSGSQPPRAGLSHPTIAPYGPFSCADGVLLVAVQNDREWRALCAAALPPEAQDPRFATAAGRLAHRGEVDALVAAALAGRTAEDADALLRAAGVASARVNDVQGLLDHPVLAGRDRWREVGTPAGPVRALLPGPELSGVTPRWGPVPALGEHTDALLAELGYDAAAVAALRAAGTV